MSANNFENIIISFSRPADAASGYAFLKEPSELPNGGLHKQIVIVVEKISLADLRREFFKTSVIVETMTNNIIDLITMAVFAAALDLISFASFPDEFSPLLKLIKLTPHGSTLNWDAINNLSVELPIPLNELLDALVSEKFLIKRGENYIVRKKILMQAQVNFI